MPRWLPLFLIAAVLPWSPLWALESQSSYRAQFAQERAQPFLKRPFKSSGRLLYWQGHGVLWQVEKPLSQTLLIGKEGVFQFKGSQKKPLLPGQAGRRLVAGLLLPLFSGQLEALEKRFEIERQGPAEAPRLIARPKDATLLNYLARLEVHLDTKGRVTEVLLEETKGGSTLIRFSQFEPTEQPSAKERALFEAPLSGGAP